MGPNRSELRPTRDGRVRPSPRDGMQQVRAELDGVLDGDFQYLSVPPQRSWVPVLDEMEAIVEPGSLDVAGRAHVAESTLGAVNWQRVIGLDEAGGRRASAYRDALREMSPESGSYTLMLRRLRAPG